VYITIFNQALNGLCQFVFKKNKKLIKALVSETGLVPLCRIDDKVKAYSVESERQKFARLF